MKTISYNYDHVGGVVNMYAIPIQDFKKVSINHQTGVKSVIVTSLDNVITLPCFAGRTSFKEDETLEEGGKLYAVEIAGFTPIASDSLIRTLERGQWLVVHQDAVGNMKLSGTNEVPLNYTGTRSSGAAPAESNGKSFRFYGSTPTPSVIIERMVEL